MPPCLLVQPRAFFEDTTAERVPAPYTLLGRVTTEYGPSRQSDGSFAPMPSSDDCQTHAETSGTDLTARSMMIATESEYVSNDTVSCVMYFRKVSNSNTETIP